MTDADKPPRRFTELPDETRRFIHGLDADDLATLKRVIRAFRMAHAWCRVNRWLFIGAVALLVMLAQGIDAVQRLLAPLTGIKH